MKKILLVFCFYFFLCVANAQVDNQKLINSKDFVCDTLTFLVLQIYVKTHPKDKVKWDSIKHKFDNIQIDNPISKSDLKKILKGKFDTVLLKLSDPINKLNIDKLISNSKEDAANKLIENSFSILNKNYRTKYKKLEKDRSSILTSVITYLKDSQPSVIVASAKQNEVIRNDSAKDKDSKESSGFFSMSNFSFWTLLPFILCIAFVIWLYLNYKKSEKKILKRIFELKSFEANSINNKRNEKLTLDPKEIEKIILDSDIVKQIIKEIYALKEEYKNITPTANTITNPIIFERTSPEVETFFMAGPVNNYFHIDAKSRTSNNTVYKFKVTTNKQVATYEIHTTGATINDILSMAESLIKPACIEENIPTTNVRNIITIKPGTATLEGDKWIINTKATIRYE